MIAVANEHVTCSIKSMLIDRHYDSSSQWTCEYTLDVDIIITVANATCEYTLDVNRQLLW